MSKKIKSGSSLNKKNKGSSSMRKKIGGLFDYIVLKEEKEVIFYLEQPFPTVLAIPSLMKERFPDDYKSIVTRDLEEFKRYKEKE